jgi:membrane protease YdiL (CAAX protease family)
MAHPAPHADRRVPPWSISDVLLAMVIAYLVAPMLLSGLMQILFPQMVEQAVFFWEQVFSFLVWIFVFVVLVWRYGRDTVGFLGLAWDQPVGAYLKYSGGTLLGVIAVIGLLALVTMLGGIEAADPYEELTQEKLRVIQVFALLTAPILEELVFRGFLQSALYRYFAPLSAVFLTSVVFALLHTAYSGNLLAIVYVGSLGLLFSFVRYRSGSLYPCMVGHLFNNILVSVGLQGGL